LQGKKSPNRRFFGVLSAKRNKLLGEGITGKVIETGNPVTIKRVADEPLFLNRTGARSGEEAREISFVCVPVTGLPPS
jgi:hypothetical protein